MNKENKTITSAAMGVLIVIIVSKIVGFVESAMLAAYFGTSVEVDMFYLANTIVNNFVFTIFSCLAVVGLTMYNTARKDDSETGNRFISALLCSMLPFSFIVTAVIFVISPYISSLMASNYTAKEVDLLTFYIRELSLVAIFYVITTIFTCVLNAHKKFVPGALMGCVQNLTLIVFIVFLSDQIGVNAVVIGFLAAYLIQTAVLYICVRRVLKFRRFSYSKDIDIKKLFLLILPLLLGEAVGEINALVDQYLATKQGVGYVSGLSYSGTLNDVVSALFMQTMTIVLLSFFSALVIEKRYDEMINELKKIIKYISLMVIPISIVTIFCADHLVSFVFERGKFNSESVFVTSQALIGYAIGFVPRIVMVVAKRPFFAIENTRIPMAIGMIAITINISLTILLSGFWGILGITVATSISHMVSCLLYFNRINSVFENVSWKDCYVFFAKVGIAAIISAILTCAVLYIKIESHFYVLVVATVVCFCTYLGVLHTLKLTELKALTLKIKNKISK
ncbi:murein biosynthesis integral membrane protein MurJ [Bacteroides oleiciplenus]|uniref:murein biosynthesis integral membrane protein MurJ n=1 Tax=Bacteroides oleiciplenus TaxID=626931 RepID=UPI0012F79FA0|nr:lipid II flippase MurJ [Bacteroides oleiciplenus]